MAEQQASSQVSSEGTAQAKEEHDAVDAEKGTTSPDREDDAPGSPALDDAAKEDGDGAAGEGMDFPAPARLGLIVGAVMLCVFLVALDLTIVSTAIPRITDEFHSVDQISWYGSAFFLTIAAFQPTWGKAFMYFDLKYAFLLSILIFELGSLMCGLANSSTTLIAGRSIAGMGGAGLSSGGYTIIAFSAKPKLRPVLIGIVGVAFCVASVIGPLLGGVFTDRLTWRWCFYINLPVGGVAMAVLFASFRTPSFAKPPPTSWKEKVLQMDFPGTFSIMAAMICLLLALQWGGVTKPWNSPDVIGTLVGFGLLSILVVVIEYYSGERALLMGRLIKDRTLGAMSAFIFFAAGVYFTLLYYLPIYFQTTRGVSAQQSGIDIVPMILSVGLFNLVSGGLMSATGFFVPNMAFGMCLAAIGSGLVYTLQVDTAPPSYIGYQILVGVGIGFVFQVPPTVAQAVVQPADLAPVSAMILFFQTLGGSVWLAVGQSNFANRLLTSLGTAAPDVSPAQVLGTGATDLRRVFSEKQVAGILVAYLDGLHTSFIIVIACACVAFLLALAPEWKKIKIQM